jgi:hypothetical protein
VNNRIKELDMRFALNNAFTPLVGDYSGLRGGTRPRTHIMSGNSSSRYPIIYPESLAVTAGRRGSSVNTSQIYKYESDMLQPTTNSHPAINIPLKHPISRRKPKVGAGRKKGMLSLTMPNELDYTTKKSSKFHDIEGHYVRNMPRPFVAGKRGLSLKDIGNALKPSNIKKSFQKLGSDIKTDYQKTSPTFKKYAKAIIPATTGFLGSALGGTVGEFAGPVGGVVGATLGGIGGKDVGNLINKKIGLGRKPKTTKAPSARGQLISKLMKQHGMSLGQASAHIKQNGLY